MKKNIEYTDEPLGPLRIIPDFLPPPELLVLKDDNVKVTLTLSLRSVYYLKREAAKNKVPYQRMIRRLVDLYADACIRAARAETPRKTTKNASSRVADAGDLLGHTGERVPVRRMHGGLAIKKAARRAQR